MDYMYTGGFIGLLRVVFKSIADFFGMILFYRAYEISTLHYNHREAFVWKPKELTPNIEYKILWKKYYLRTKLVTPMICVKSKGNKIFSKLVIVVTASNEKVKYQDCITLINVDSTPTYTSIPSTPFRNLKFKDNLVYTPYDNFQIIVLEAYDSEGNKINLYDNKKYISPCDRLEVELGKEKGDIERWGEVFNLEFIENDIREERIRLIGSSFKIPAWLYNLRLRLFSVDWVVKLIYWSKNIVFAKQISKRFIKYLKKQEEYNKLDEGEQKEPIE